MTSNALLINTNLSTHAHDGKESQRPSRTLFEEIRPDVRTSCMVSIWIRAEQHFDLF